MESSICFYSIECFQSQKKKSSAISLTYEHPIQNIISSSWLVQRVDSIISAFNCGNVLSVNSFDCLPRHLYSPFFSFGNETPFMEINIVCSEGASTMCDWGTYLIILWCVMCVTFATTMPAYKLSKTGDLTTEAEKMLKNWGSNFD